MRRQQVAVLLFIAKVVCGGVVDGPWRQDPGFECDETLNLDFSGPEPQVECSSPCEDSMSTWSAGPLYRREARLAEYGLMVRQEYSQDGAITCSLVSDMPDIQALQSALEIEACTSMPDVTYTSSPLTTVPSSSTPITEPGTSPEVTTVQGTSPEVTSVEGGSTPTTPPGGSTLISLPSTSPEITSEPSSTPTTVPGSSTEVTGPITTVSTEATTLLECLTEGDPKEAPTTTTTERPWVCESGWQLHEASCYKVDDEARDWYKGRNYCRDLHADYATISTEDEFQFLRGFVTYDSWIGLQDQFYEGRFEWADGSASTFSAWYEREPNNSGNEDCTEMRSSMSFYWNDSKCQNKKRSLCEKPATK